MTEHSGARELEFMAMGILSGAVLGFLLFILLGNFTIGIGLGVGFGLIISDVVYKRKSGMGSGG